MAYMLPTLAAASAIIYTLVGISSLFFLGGTDPRLAYPVIFGSAFALYAMRLTLTSKARPSRQTLPVTVMAVLVVLATPAAFFITTGSGDQLLGIAIMALAAGFLILNLFALLFVEAVIAAVFVTAVFVNPDAGHWLQSGYSLTLTALAGFAIYAVRRRGISRLAHLRQNDERHRTVLARALNEANESERRFRLLSGAAFEGIVALRGSEIRDINTAGAAIFGAAPDDLIGGPVQALGATTDGRDLAAALSSSEDQDAEGHELAFVRGDRTRLALEARSRKVRSRGEETLVIAVRDVTDRKQNEAERARLSRERALILDSTGEGIIGLDSAGRVKFANKAATRLLMGGGAELDGELHEHWLHTPEHPHRDDCPITAAYTRGETHQVTAAMFSRRYADPMPVDYVSAPIIQDGSTTGAVIAFRDITDRIEVERMKDEFVSVVSHELKTPLTSMSGALRLLDSGRLGDLPPAGARMLEIASENTDRLIRLVNDILDVERFRAGKAALEPVVIDVVALAKGAQATMSPMASAAGVDLRVDTVPVEVRADPDRLIQALTNLLSNAIKFSPRGGVVTLKVAPQGEDVRISVQDQGPGIPRAHRTRIFERFHQVDSSHAREKGGTGLGLAICRWIAEAHGGTIGVDSPIGEGSTFFLILPKRGPPIASNPSKESS